MNILGISYSSNHESAAALLQEGRVVFAASEERFSRLKHDPRFPFQAIERALAHAGLAPTDIHQVAIGMGRPGSAGWHNARMLLTGKMPSSFTRWERTALGLLHEVRAQWGYRDYRRRFGTPRGGVQFVDHHRAHALSASCLSGFAESAVLVIDGRGAREATTLWHARGGELRLLEQYDFPDSLGAFYAAVTEHLGFRPLSDEWKVMGLAAYGEPRADLSALIEVREEGYRVQGRRLFGRDDLDKSGLAAILGPPRRSDDAILPAHRDLARSAQDACERAMVALARRAAHLTGSRRLCLAGGVTLNCKANGEISRAGLFDDLYIQPAAGDDGVALGAAFDAHLATGRPLAGTLGHSYLGTEYSDEDIEPILATYKLPYRRVEDAAGAAAALLAADQLVGWFQGRMEFGPRALGGRSILADPRRVENRDRVNAAVKFREDWRPFAPSVLEERGSRYFRDFRPSPYMILSFWATEEARREIPAVVHVDGSCRVQSVTPASNPLYYALLSAFERLTGVGACMNTSFNLKGDAIVESPKDAIQTFYASGLDALVIGRFVVEKRTG